MELDKIDSESVPMVRSGISGVGPTGFCHFSVNWLANEVGETQIIRHEIRPDAGLNSALLQ